MYFMQEDSKLVSHCFALRSYRPLEQMVLNIWRQLSPHSYDSVSQRTKNLLLCLSWQVVHSNLRSQISQLA